MYKISFKSDVIFVIAIALGVQFGAYFPVFAVQFEKGSGELRYMLLIVGISIIVFGIIIKYFILVLGEKSSKTTQLFKKAFASKTTDLFFAFFLFSASSVGWFTLLSEDPQVGGYYANGMFFLVSIHFFLSAYLGIKWDSKTNKKSGTER